MTRSVRLKNILVGEGLPKICVPMVGVDKEELCREAEALVAAGADMAEWRADFFSGLFDQSAVEDILKTIAGILEQIPIIFTIRTAREGSELQISTEDYVNINQKVSELGIADLIDVEALTEEGKMRRLINRIHENGGKVIASSHNFTAAPPKKELFKLMQKLDKAGGDILKIAVMPKTLFDVWELLEATNDMTVEYTEKPVVTMAMGDMGGLSRFSGELFGSSITFGVVGKASAPGQIPIEELRELMGIFHKDSHAGQHAPAGTLGEK
ncbi:MAG: type I 3-dehydroquinate dehydratase [Blautia sp.]|jgi:3-dehydroquinate dehydratase-1